VSKERSDRSSVRLRADARRNREEIRRAALDIFRVNGLGAPLDDVARAAGVSKGTIYHRFGGRQELIDDVVDDLAREHIEDLIARATAEADPRSRFERYLGGIWMLQFDEPAVSDVLTRYVPESTPLTELCTRAKEVLDQLLCEAQDASVLRPELTSLDLYRFIWERGVILRSESRPDRRDYQRHCEYLIHGLRPPPRRAES
jgi:AcrR family transcriptional regulator